MADDDQKRPATSCELQLHLANGIWRPSAAVENNLEERMRVKIRS